MRFNANYTAGEVLHTIFNAVEFSDESDDHSKESDTENQLPKGERHQAAYSSNHSDYEGFVLKNKDTVIKKNKINKNKSYLKMQFIGKSTSRPRILRRSIEKQKWWDAAGITIFCAEGSEELDAPTGIGWDAATGPLSAENKEENLCAFLIISSGQNNKIY